MSTSTLDDLKRYKCDLITSMTMAQVLGLCNSQVANEHCPLGFVKLSGRRRSRDVPNTEDDESLARALQESIYLEQSAPRKIPAKPPGFRPVVQKFASVHPSLLRFHIYLASVF